MVVVLLHIIFVEANPRFQTRCRTCPSRYPQSSLLTLNAPSVVPVEAASIDVRHGEAMIVLEREVPSVVLETDISEAGEYLPGAEVGPGNEPNSSARITGEIEEPDVFGGTRVCILSLLVEPCSYIYVLYPRFFFVLKPSSITKHGLILVIKHVLFANLMLLLYLYRIT